MSSNNNALTAEQIEALEGMIARRMEGTGETREQASRFLKDYLNNRISSNK
jgi:hypothetical protein